MVRWEYGGVEGFVLWWTKGKLNRVRLGVGGRVVVVRMVD